MSFAGVQVRGKVAAPRAARAAVVVRANARREMLGAGAAALAAALLMPLSAQAGLIEDLKAKSATNKAIHDKQRLATSYANVQRARTLQDGSCQFPNNFVGCEKIDTFHGGIPFITDDIKTECDGTDKTTCASKVQAHKKRN